MTDENHSKVRTRAPRLIRRLRVTYRRFGQTRRHIGYTVNLSRSGMFVLGLHLEDRGVPMLLDVETPGGLLQLRAVVAWSRFVPYHLRGSSQMGFGVRLVDVPPQWDNFISLS